MSSTGMSSAVERRPGTTTFVAAALNHLGTPVAPTQLFGVIDPPGNRGTLCEQMAAPFNAPRDPLATPTMDGFVADYLGSLSEPT
jgi:hypothetical protein